MTRSSFKKHRCGTERVLGKRKKNKKLVHIDKLINGSVQGFTHIHTTCRTHTLPHTQTTVKKRRPTSLPSLDAAQREDVLLVGEELPHLVERLLPPDGELVPRLWSGQDLTD